MDIFCDTCSRILASATGKSIAAYHRDGRLFIGMFDGEDSYWSEVIGRRRRSGHVGRGEFQFADPRTPVPPEPDESWLRRLAA